MGKAEGIRIFLRLRPPVTAQHSSLLASSTTGASYTTPCDYDVEHTFDESKLRLRLHRRESNEVVNNSVEDYTFSFRRVFEPQSTQAEVFATVAQDSVRSVLDGYNSTVFAYGQTGSGKTYSITGGTDSYDDRGLIPRALAMIFEEVSKRKECNWTVSLSYLQIYNDRGQDLLNHGRDARNLDELPSVTVHETDEEVTLRGLESHYAATLGEALNLLFLGDTNRLYCETPMNKTSSRSHCVFTIALEARVVGSSVVRRSKLNLVDLAGSERVAKSGVGGTILTEAKYINLSLHYLEHVIIALSEQAKGRRDHVPFRNSFMTMVLRDSLGGNCRTAMLATAHLAQAMLPETISTCQFAQRVALIRQDAHVNEETDPLVLVRKLKAEVNQLRDQLAFYEKGDATAGRVLSEDEKLICRTMVQSFLAKPEPEARIEGFEGDLARIYYCFDVLKEMLRGTNSNISGAATSGHAGSGAAAASSVEAATTELRAEVDALHVNLQQKENEMNLLLDMLRKTRGLPVNATTQTLSAADGASASGGVAECDVESIRQLVQRLRSRTAQAVDSTASTAASNGVCVNDDVHTAVQPAPVVKTDTVLARVTELTRAGQLSPAEAVAATDYLKAKEARLAESYNLSALTDNALVEGRAKAFEAFKTSYKNYAKVEAAKAELKERYAACKDTASKLNATVDTIKRVKTQVQRLRVERAAEGIEEVDPAERALLDELGREKANYNALAATLRSQKENIDSMHAFMKRSQEQLTRDYEEWLEVRQGQVSLALQPSHAPHTNNIVPSPASVRPGADATQQPTQQRPPLPAVLPPVVAGSPAMPGPGIATTTPSGMPLRPMLPLPLQTMSSAAAATKSDVDTTRHPASAPDVMTSNTTTTTTVAATSSSANKGHSYTVSDTMGLAGLSALRPQSRLSPPASLAQLALPQNNAWLAPNNVNRHNTTGSSSGSNGAGGYSVSEAQRAMPSTAPATTTALALSATPVNTSMTMTMNGSLAKRLEASVTGSLSGRNGMRGDDLTASRMLLASTSAYHLQPLASAGTTQPLPPSLPPSAPVLPLPTMPSLAATASSVSGNSSSGEKDMMGSAGPRNPFAPEHRSTGNSAADEQLAALYKAREVLRAQLQ